MMKRMVLLTAAVALLIALSGCSSADKAVEMGAQSGLAQQLLGSFGDVGKILGSITGTESASSIVPKLDAVGVDLDQLAKEAEGASPEVQAGLSDVAVAQIPGLQKTIDTAYAIPGVKPMVEPSVDSLLAKFAGFK